MELVGLGYTGWFVYRYLLFKVLIVLVWVHHLTGSVALVTLLTRASHEIQLQESRKQLADDVESLKKSIAGAEEE
jgi:biopolymer transport protein ExbB/TolQ